MILTTSSAARKTGWGKRKGQKEQERGRGEAAREADVEGVEVEH